MKFYLKFALITVIAAGLFLVGRASAATDEFEFKGVVQSLPGGVVGVGDWVVAGRIVRVTAATEIRQENGRIAVGTFVEVEGFLRADNSVDAKKVKFEDDGPGRAPVEFKGTIQSFPAGFVGDWLIGGRVVHTTAATRIRQEDGPVAIGAFVEVEGTPRADGSIDASKIDVKSNAGGGDGRHELKGTIQSLPAGGLIGDWTVSGRVVHVTGATVIEQNDGPAVVGALVEVKGTLRPDGSLDASKIETKRNFGDGGQARVNFKGTVESFPAGFVGDWRVSGRTVHVTAATEIRQQHGAIAVGARVKVKGTQLADGSIQATRVQVRDSQ